MKYDVLVVGAGAAGLLAAGTAASRGMRVLLLEKNDRPGRKLMITGKGRCNVTNACSLLNDLLDNVPGNPRFLYSAFSRFMPADMIDLIENEGVPLKIERGNRVFPVSDKAADIVDALVRFVKRNGVRLLTGVRVRSVEIEGGAVAGVKDADGRLYEAKNVIVATGGMSYPLTGSTGDGYRFAEQAGHTVTPLRPSLVPLELEAPSWRRAQGLTLKNCAIRVEETCSCREVYSDFGELLFTHFGVSGPVILSASAHLRDIAPGKYTLYIDLKPALSEEKLDARLVREFTSQPNKTLGNVLPALLPHSVIPVITAAAGADPARKVNQIPREERRSLVYAMKNLSAPIAGTRSIEEAVVTAGGVSVKEIDPRTMESRLCRGLYFAGEVIDVDAYTGGFNLQIAFSTGAAAAYGAAAKEEKS